MKKPFRKFQGGGRPQRGPVKPTFRKSQAATEPVRLNKYIANAGVCSRREADNLILEGLITVNGEKVTTLGTKVQLKDEVRYKGELLRAEKLVYVLLNKPKDYITTSDDPQGRRTVLDLVRDAGRERLFPVGRLDRMTTGLLLLTNDGAMTKVLTHPKHNVRKNYQVHLNKPFAEEDLAKLRSGFELEDGPIKADAASYSAGKVHDPKSIGLILHSGRNRIVRRMMEHLGYKVVRLDRVGFAGLTKKGVPRGKWRFLSEKEVGMLKMIS
ncbi:MAG: pseudouridine synthase [Salibacteraceae bacterium]